jgi:succinate dehydrogenase / fumarate reductase cytochrome b subunit
LNKKRPVNLDLTTIKFPPAAISSILHRVSGVLVFLFIPLLLWLLHLSLDRQGFSDIQTVLASPFTKLLLWITLSGLLYHLIAGIRHLLMDMHIADGKESGNQSARIVIILSLILIVLMGGWLWFIM